MRRPPRGVANLILQLVILTEAGRYVDYVTFHFSKGMYVVSGHRTELMPNALFVSYPGTGPEIAASLLNYVFY